MKLENNLSRSGSSSAGGGGLFFLDAILLEGTHEGQFVGRGLETTMTHFGGGIDELEFDLFQSRTLGVFQQSLTQGKDTFLGTDTAALDHDEIVSYFTIMRETTHGGDGLVGQIVLSGGVVLDNLAIHGVDTGTNAVDLLVDFGTVVVTLLTGTCHSGGHTRRMPGTNTGNLTQTLVSLAGQFLGVPTGSDTLETFTLGNTNAIDHFVLAEDIADGDGLFQMFLNPLNLIFNGTTVQLDFHNMSLLLALLDQTDLSVSNNADDLAVTEHLTEIVFNALLAQIIIPFLAGLGESFSFRFVPVLVETTTAFFG